MHLREEHQAANLSSNDNNEAAVGTTLAPGPTNTPVLTGSPSGVALSSLTSHRSAASNVPSPLDVARMVVSLSDPRFPFTRMVTFTGVVALGFVKR